MAEMYQRGILPDLRRRLVEAGEESVIVSRVLRTWGASESALAEALQGRIDALDADAATGGGPNGETGGNGDANGNGGTATIAFLASGIEGIKVRITGRASSRATVGALLDAEEHAVRSALADQLGETVFGVDDETMEQAVAALLVARDLSLGVAESLTGGLIASRLVDVPGASRWFRGGIVAYDSAVKHSVLGVPAGPVVTEAAAAAMAEGARQVLGATVGLGITGVAGPDEQEEAAPGTVFVGLSLPGDAVVTRALHLPGDRPRVRQYSAISALDLLRRELLARPSG
jgi:nicotinamide-nucleotide amidase